MQTMSIYPWIHPRWALRLPLTISSNLTGEMRSKDQLAVGEGNE
jgi:hypothetical protein